MTIFSWIGKLFCFQKRHQHQFRYNRLQKLSESTQTELPPLPKPDVSVKATKSFSQIWTIENFSTLVKDLVPGGSLDSTEFSLDSIRFTVSLYPSGKNRNYRDYVSIYLDKGSENRDLNIMCHFWIVAADNQKVYGHKFIRKISRSNGCHEWIRKEDLLNPEKAYLVNGNLTIGFEVAILVNEKIKVYDSGPNQILANLSDLWKMRYEYSDVVIQVSDGTEFLAYKAILIAQSPVFAAMFRHKTSRESLENRIVIPDMSGQMCEVFLKYLYTGNVESLESCAQDLLPLADKYQIDHLKSICEQSLCCQIASENVGQLKLLADRHNSKILFDKCCDFTKKRTLESVKNLIEIQGKEKEIEKMLIKITRDCLVCF